MRTYHSDALCEVEILVERDKQKHPLTSHSSRTGVRCSNSMTSSCHRVRIKPRARAVTRPANQSTEAAGRPKYEPRVIERRKGTLVRDAYTLALLSLSDDSRHKSPAEAAAAASAAHEYRPIHSGRALVTS